MPLLRLALMPPLPRAPRLPLLLDLISSNEETIKKGERRTRMLFNFMYEAGNSNSVREKKDRETIGRKPRAEGAHVQAAGSMELSSNDTD